MRIPLSQVDWPDAFNYVSKFIGRNWPSGKLKFNQAQEVSAFLFGYNSVHDVKKETQFQVSLSDVSISEFARSMSLKALAKYKLNPDVTLKLFSELPWRALSCWAYTEEYKRENSEKTAYFSRDGVPFIVDEMGYYAGTKTNELLVRLIDAGYLPNVEYAVNEKGLMYRRGTFERLLNSLAIQKDDLTELGFNGSPDEFVREYMESMAWLPIKARIKTKDYRGNDSWAAPFLRTIVDEGNGYRIYHEGYQAFYGNWFTDTSELERAVIDLYLNKPIAITSNGAHTMQVAGEYFERPSWNEFKSYQPLMNASCLAHIDWSDVKLDVAIDASVLSPEIQLDHARIEAWKVSEEKRVWAISEHINEHKLENVLSAVMPKEKTTLATLQERECYLPSGADDTENECDDGISEAFEIGEKILGYHPELSPYYDEVAVCDAYQDYNSNTGDWLYPCSERDLGFISYVFGEACVQHFAAGSQEEWRLVAATLLIDLTNEELECGALTNAARNMSALLSMHAEQSRRITKMKQWAEYQANPDNRYLSTGGPAQIARKSWAEIMHDQLNNGRKFNVVSQAQTRTGVVDVGASLTQIAKKQDD